LELAELEQGKAEQNHDLDELHTKNFFDVDEKEGALRPTGSNVRNIRK
jgi:hypothetical protein